MKNHILLTDTLRAVINYGNPVLAKRNAETGALSGVTVDVANELARRLNAKVSLTGVPNAAASVAALTDGTADLGFVAIDPARAETVRFSPPYVIIEGAYAVPIASPITRNEDVDKKGVRVATAKASAYDLYLTRALKEATIERTVTSAGVVSFMLEQKLEVAANIKQQLEAEIAKNPGLRLLPGRFMIIEQAIGIPAARAPEAAKFIRDFVEELKASGFIGEALARHGIQGAAVAPKAEK
jgi:polar amino acid transport system substrate-binding protein